MCSRKELSFSVFIIHHLAHAWGVSPSFVYQTLNDTHIMDDYVIGCYDLFTRKGSRLW
jgi:chloramphenicol O-acetyltransferase